MPKDVVLLLPRHATSWRKMLELALLIKEKGSFTPVMVLANNEMRNHANECQELGIAYESVAPTSSGGAIHFIDRYERLAHSFIPSLFKAWSLYRKLKKEYQLFAEIFDRHSVKAVLVPGDRELSPVPAMLRLAKDKNIPSIIACSNVPTVEGVAQLRHRYSRFRVNVKYIPPILNLLAARIAPQQVKDTPYGKLLFSPGWITLVLRHLKMLSNNPWVQGGGNSTYVFVTDARHRHLLVSQGMPSEKAIIVGDHMNDPLFEIYKKRQSIKKSLIKKHKLDANKPLIVCAVPIYAEHRLSDWETHLKGLKSYFDVLSRYDAEILLSLHPKSSLDRYTFLEKEYGCHVATESLSEVLAAGDLFLCGNSSTVAWARLAGITSINMDYIALKDADFVGQEALGTINTTTAEEFDSALSTVLKKETALADSAQLTLLRECFDGKAGARIIQFIEEKDKLCA